MAWWQKKLLRYALSRSGLLDDKALDLDNLDITFGKKNVVELKDVGLNIGRIVKLAQLPPSLRIETARILFLRLTVPADIYQASIIAEVDGVELNLRLEEKHEDTPQERKTRPRSPVTSRVPSHRKVHRRLHSPPPNDYGGTSELDDLRIPTTEELAKSFLLEEPIQKRRELEASVVAGEKSLEESTVSESSGGGDVGTGATIGLPGFLANFLQGILDRLQVIVRNVEVKLETEVSSDSELTVPVTLRLHVGGADLASLASDEAAERHQQTRRQAKRQLKLSDLSLDLLSNAAVFSDLSEVPSHTSPTESRQREHSHEVARTLDSRQDPSTPTRPMSPSTHQSFGSVDSGGPHSSPKSPDAVRASILTLDVDRFADAGDDDVQSTMQSAHADLDIQPGDDNISWASRRSKSNAPADDMWSSMTSEDAMPESLLLPNASRSHVRPFGLHNTAAARTRRDVSPFERGFEGPGSWPRLEESPNRQRYQQSPGSWPTADQSQHSLFQPLSAPPAITSEESIDNKKTALEASMIEQEHFDTPPEPAEGTANDLAASRIFTHEEAESMYLSAMAYSSRMHVPGGWSSEDDQLESSPPFTDAQPRVLEQSTLLEDRRHVDDDLAYGEQPYRTPENVTPRARSPDSLKHPNRDSIEIPEKASRQLLLVDMVSVWIPVGEASTDEEEYSKISSQSQPNAKPAQHSMPGSFSVYSDMSASRRSPVESFRQDSRTSTLPPRDTPRARSNLSLIQIEIGVVKGQLDMPCGRLLYRLFSQASSVLGLGTESRPDRGKQNEEASVVVTVFVQDVWLAFRESAASSLKQTSFSKPAENLISIGCRHIEFTSRPGKADARLGSFTAFIGSSQFLAFFRNPETMSSVIIDDKTPDIALTLINKNAEFKRPISEVTLETMTLNILLDLSVVDETFEAFGGLSGVLEVGNSILSESSFAASPSSPRNLAKGVRFEGDPQSIGEATELKVNARIGGVSATLQGSVSSVQMRTTTIKAVYREYGSVATIAQVVLTGPKSTESDVASTSIDLSTLRLEYFVTAQDSDLERLLSLLTPSRDKYENDDDILLDTLFRQRKKGAVIRAFIKELKVDCEDTEDLSMLTTLGDELSKLSVVAKYLPEDERPSTLR